MDKKNNAVIDNLKYLELLSLSYKNIQAASTEIINLQAICNLPKGTEHFMSDLHGEYQAFEHILNNASGAIRGKIDTIFSATINKEERIMLSTLIYYPNEKLEEVSNNIEDPTDWYRVTLNRLIQVCKLVTSKYTISKVRKALPKDFSYIIEELLHIDYSDHNKVKYYENIINTIIEIERAQEFIVALCDTIKALIVDHLHIVGDIFDRGPRADIILDSLMEYHSLDIQWGNHDVLWMGAATGSRTCISVVLNNSITYNNLDVIEVGYGISLRPLAVFAQDIYKNTDVSCFMPKNINYKEEKFSPKDIELAARMNKAISIIRFKLEGQIIKRNPDFKMNDRLLLDKIDFNNKTVNIGGKNYKLKDCDFPTIDKNNPYELSEEEVNLMKTLKTAFLRSEKLQKHIKFLYAKGEIYKCFNSNLLYHGCMPLNEDGTLMEFKINGKKYLGKSFMDFADNIARSGYYANPESEEKQFGKDFLWFLWCGRNSPLFGRDKIATFERVFIEDDSTWKEEKNAYYKYNNDEKTCENILKHFGITNKHSHIINGHMPVKTKDGESPIKANGKLIIIDGGFCKAYQSTTGIAGYTLIYNSHGMRLFSHKPFAGYKDAVSSNKDIYSTCAVFETATEMIKVGKTDTGIKIKKKIEDLKLLLQAYREGLIKEKFTQN